MKTSKIYRLGLWNKREIEMNLISRLFKKQSQYKVLSNFEEQIKEACLYEDIDIEF